MRTHLRGVGCFDFAHGRPPLTRHEWLLFEEKMRELIAADLAADPAMCEPDLKPKPTAHITRVIDQGPTLARWNDQSRTWTMETVKVEA